MVLGKIISLHTNIFDVQTTETTFSFYLERCSRTKKVETKTCGKKVSNKYDFGSSFISPPATTILMCYFSSYYPTHISIFFKY